MKLLSIVFNHSAMFFSDVDLEALAMYLPALKALIERIEEDN